MTEGHNLNINGDRLWDSLMEMAKIGATEKGGNCRLALTDLDREGRDLFVNWCRDAGCTIRVDRIGNIFARRPGRNNDLDPVVTGSHLDTQPTGGRFDGVYGVLAGLEVVRSLNDMNIETERPIEVAVWTNEEGSRFAPSMIASAVFAGVYDLDFGLACADEDGKTMGEELKRIGYDGEDEVGGRDFHAFFETHIEQGPILENEEITIGVVTGAQGQKWYELNIQGQESHAGPTPMPVRKDALLAASRVVELVNQVGLAHAPDGCATVGMLNVHPNSRNVIPGHVFMTIDFRHPDATQLATMDQTMRAALEEIAERSRVEIDCQQIMDLPPQPFDGDCVSSVQKAADDMGFSSRRIVSGAGHDACNIATVAPTSMIFIPCIDGISHNEVEDAKPEWIHAGGNVLLRAMLERAE